MSYRDGVFAQKEAARRALRDEKRDAFFAEYSAPRLRDPFQIETDGATQHSKVMELIAIARAGHNSDQSGLDALDQALKTLQFGIANLPIRKPNQVSLAQVLGDRFQAAHFNMSWANWFDD